VDESFAALVVLSAAGRVRGDLAEVPPQAVAAQVAGTPDLVGVAQAIEGPWRAQGGDVLSRGDSRWPSGLAALGPLEPLLLWVRGDLPRAASQCVSVVGSRVCTSYGRRCAAALARAVTGAGRTVVSGGAHGIDSEAHRAALQTGTTVLVAAGGAGRVYPDDHAGLFARAARQGAVVWEFPPGSRLTRSGFLHRNRLIAALSCTTVVVEAAQRSGALNTGRTAADLGRLVVGVPGPIDSPASAGVHRGICDGWAALVAGPEDLVGLLPGREPA
jgi:DNA processing protein